MAIQVFGVVLLVIVGAGLVHGAARPGRFPRLSRRHQGVARRRQPLRPGDDRGPWRLSLHFVYPPHALVALAAIIGPLTESLAGEIILAAIYAALVLSIPWQQTRWLLAPYRRQWPALGFILFFALFGVNGFALGPFGFAGLVAAYCGSITLPLYAVAFIGSDMRCVAGHGGRSIWPCWSRRR